MRNRNLYLVAFLVIVVIFFVVWPSHILLPQSEKKFVELAELITLETEHGWSIAQQPRNTGPYRLSLKMGKPCLMRGESVRGLTCRLRDDQGEVIEEVKLNALTETDQMVIYLDTADGLKTMAVLKKQLDN